LQPFASHPALAPDAAIDLQLHTTASDGTWTPQSLVDYLVREEFALAAVTDHHRMDTVTEIQRRATERQLAVLAGVEMSTTWRDNAVDVLCYGFPAGHNDLFELAAAVAGRHLENAQTVSIQLQWQGYRFPRQQEVLREMGGEPRHANDLALLLQAHGYGPASAVWPTLHEAGARWSSTDLATVVAAAHRSGAICVIAHPGRGGEDHHGFAEPLLEELCQQVPIDGLEVYYPRHTPQQTAMYLAYAHRRGLLVSAGSDSHGPHRPPVRYRAEVCCALLERIGIKVR